MARSLSLEERFWPRVKKTKGIMLSSNLTGKKLCAGDKGWGWNRQKAIWRTEQRKGSKNVKAN